MLRRSRLLAVSNLCRLGATREEGVLVVACGEGGKRKGERRRVRWRCFQPLTKNSTPFNSLALHLSLLFTPSPFPLYRDTLAFLNSSATLLS